MKIKSAEFVISNQKVTACPHHDKPEYAFIGRSNVGKSSLINALLDDDSRLIGSYSEKLGRGRHETRVVEFLESNEAFIADTPGFSKLDLSSMKKEDIKDNFIEFNKYKCDCALFNGLVPYEGNRKVHNKRTKRVRRFSDVSYAGGPGFAFTKKFKTINKVQYDEKIGYPNEICFGEDSLFYKKKQLIRQKRTLWKISS